MLTLPLPIGQSRRLFLYGSHEYRLTINTLPVARRFGWGGSDTRFTFTAAVSRYSPRARIGKRQF